MTRRFISYKCMFCHNAVPQIPDGHDAPGSDPVYTGELPQGIDCQRCHGPGARHVEVVGRHGSKSADVRASIVNPARLDAARSMEICMSCHLETTSGRIPATIVRFDRAPFSYVPGEPLANFMLTFDHAPGTGHDDKFEAVSSVYRLRQSKCFNQSGGKLTCVTCHDPHSAPRGADAVARYSQKCAGCHTPHVATTDCVTCHMPKRRAEDTPGMVMTDHLIQRRPPARDLVAGFRERPPELYLGEVVPYYPKTADPLYYAVAQVGNKNNLEAGLPLLRRELALRKPVEPTFYDVLADATGDESLRRRPKTPPALTPCCRIGSATPVKRCWKPASSMPPSTRYAARCGPIRPTTLRGTSRAAPWPRSGVARGLLHFERALRLRPGHPTYLYDYGLALARAGRYAEARPAPRPPSPPIRTSPRTGSADEYPQGHWESASESIVAANKFGLAMPRDDADNTQISLGL